MDRANGGKGRKAEQAIPGARILRSPDAMRPTAMHLGAQDSESREQVLTGPRADAPDGGQGGRNTF